MDTKKRSLFKRNPGNRNPRPGNPVTLPGNVADEQVVTEFPDVVKMAPRA